MRGTIGVGTPHSIERKTLAAGGRVVQVRSLTLSRFSAKLGIWQVSACKIEPRSGIIILTAPEPVRANPPAAKLFVSMLCGVPTPILPPINKVCAPIFSEKKTWVFTIPRTVTHQSKDGHPAEGSIVQTQSIIATLGSILDSQLS